MNSVSAKLRRGSNVAQNEWLNTSVLPIDTQVLERPRGKIVVTLSSPPISMPSFPTTTESY
jgi:hypothetical protein